MKLAEADALADGLVKQVTGYVQRAKAPLTAGLADLEARVAALEARALSYEGVHRAGVTYTRGACVSHAGSLWAAVRDVPVDEDVPGHTSAWQLIVKRGRGA